MALDVVKGTITEVHVTKRQTLFSSVRTSDEMSMDVQHGGGR